MPAPVLFILWEHCCTYTWDGLHRDRVSSSSTERKEKQQESRVMRDLFSIVRKDPYPLQNPERGRERDGVGRPGLLGMDFVAGRGECKQCSSVWRRLVPFSFLSVIFGASSMRSSSRCQFLGSEAVRIREKERRGVRQPVSAKQRRGASRKARKCALRGCWFWRREIEVWIFGVR